MVGSRFGGGHIPAFLSLKKSVNLLSRAAYKTSQQEEKGTQVFHANRIGLSVKKLNVL
ncbi:hypothetical protein GCM10027341_17260 [Spirosoma knui]